MVDYEMVIVGMIKKQLQIGKYKEVIMHISVQ